MSECIDCGIKLALLNSMPNGRCKKCHGLFLSSQIDTEALHTSNSNNFADKLKQERALEELERAKRKLAAAVLLTTETAPNLKITKRIEVITAECAFGMNIFKDLFASVRDIVGGRSAAVQKTMRDSRRTALYELKKEAYEVGANAVVGVDLDYVELSASGSMVLLVASGTAVIIED